MMPDVLNSSGVKAKLDIPASERVLPPLDSIDLNLIKLIQKAKQHDIHSPEMMAFLRQEFAVDVLNREILKRQARLQAEAASLSAREQAQQQAEIDFLTKEIQRVQNGVWMSDQTLTLMLQSLGFGDVYIQVAGKDFSYKAAQGTGPQAYLINHGNVHWTSSFGATVGDGNCGLHALADIVAGNMSTILAQRPQIARHLSSSQNSAIQRQPAASPAQQQVEAGIREQTIASDRKIAQRVEKLTALLSRLDGRQLASVYLAALQQEQLDSASGAHSSSILAANQSVVIADEVTGADRSDAIRVLAKAGAHMDTITAIIQSHNMPNPATVKQTTFASPPQASQQPVDAQGLADMIAAQNVLTHSF